MKFSLINNLWQLSQFTFEMISIWCLAAYLAKELEDSWPSGSMFLLLFRFFLPGSSICSSLTFLQFLYAISTSFCFFLTLFKFQQQGFKLFREWTQDSLIWEIISCEHHWEHQCRRDKKEETTRIKWYMYADENCIYLDPQYLQVMTVQF